MAISKVVARPPRPEDYQHIHAPDDLARMLLSYFAAHAVQAGVSNQKFRKVTISPSTARRIGRIRIFNRHGMEVPHRVWQLPMAFWYAVDEAGNAFECSDEGWATHLTFAQLRKKSSQQLKQMLHACNPFAGVVDDD